MHADQEIFINNVEDILSKVATKTLNDKGLHYQNSEEYIFNFLGVARHELITIIQFITDLFPETLYLDRYESVRDYVRLELSKQLILFLPQEDKNSDDFKNNLENFREELLSLIINDIYVASDV